MDLKERLSGDLRITLPHLDSEKVELVSNFLLEKGVKKERDLRRMTVELLSEVLDYVDSSDLVEEWQIRYGASQAITQRSEGLGEPHGHDTGGPSSSSGPHTAPSYSLPTFEEDSPYIPSKVRAAIKAKKRPPCSAREHMVGRIVDRCREIVPNLVRQNFNDVALELVRKWPESFKDTLPVSKHGSDSLATQMKVKYDNDKRPLNSRVGKENTVPAIPEAYGCELWNPALPHGHTNESQEKLMHELPAMAKLPKSKLDMRALLLKMKDSYYLQRVHINGSLPTEAAKRGRKRSHKEANKNNETQAPQGMKISALKENWPFLFVPAGINIHFKQLTNVDFRDNLSRFIREEATDLIDYLATRNEVLARINRRAMRVQDQAGESAILKFVGLLEMLIQYFGDEMKSFIRFTEKTVTYDELKDFADLPEDKTPILVAAGESLYEFDKLFVFIDNTVVASVKNIEEGFAFIFSAYFIFNIIFSSQLATLLTYTQRTIAGINPDTKGSKNRNPTITRKVNDRVVKLVNRMQEYKEKMEQERLNDLH